MTGASDINSKRILLTTALAVLLIATGSLAQGKKPNTKLIQHVADANKATTVVPQPNNETDKCVLQDLFVRLRKRVMPDLKGCVYENIKGALAIYRPAIEPPNGEPSTFPSGQISYQNPDPDSRLLKDTVITLRISNGLPPAQPLPNEASVDVAVHEKLLSKGPFHPGQPVKYTIIVSNAGPDPATQIELTDNQTNLKITSVSGDCIALPCLIPVINSNGTATVQVAATIVSKGASGSVAAATAKETDRNKLDNTAKIYFSGEPKPSADVSVTETLASPGPYLAHQVVRYMIVVSNAGPSVATNIEVVNKQTNLTLVEVTGDCKELPCTIANLAVGDVRSITVEASIDNEGAFSNYVEAEVRDDPVPENNRYADNGGKTTKQWEIPWFWIVLGVLVALGSTVVLGLLTWLLRRLFHDSNRIHVSLTPDQISIQPSLEGPYYPGFPGTLPLTGPPIGIETDLELVDHGPDGPMPIISTEVRDD